MARLAEIVRSRLPLILVAGAFVLSVAGSWVPAIWTDEGATVSAATRDPADLMRLLDNIDAVHGTYYFLMQGWFALVPVSAFTLRLPSAVAVAVTTALLWRLGLRLGGRTVATYVTILFIALPRVTWMGAEGRSSAFSTLAAVGATVLLVGWIENSSLSPQSVELIDSVDERSEGRWRLALWGVVALAGIYLHLYLALLVLAHALTVGFLAKSWRQRGAFACVAALVAVGSLPLVLAARGQSAQIAEGEGLLTSIRQAVVNQYFLGETPMDGRLWQVCAVALALICWGLAVWGGLRRGTDRRAILWLTLPWLVLPTMLVLGWSLVGQDLYRPRYFAFCVPALALLVGRGLAGLSLRWQRATAVAVVIALALPVYVSQRTPYAKSGYDWTPVATYVQEHAAEGEGVYFAPVPTTRTIAIVYPQQFAEVSDLTLAVSAAQDASLAGESRPLADSLNTSSPAVIWAIWRTDYVNRAEDVATFADHGYTAGRVWEGPRTQVVEFTRPV